MQAGFQRFILTSILLAAFWAPASAGRDRQIQDKATYAIYLSGIKAGVLILNGISNGNAYAVAGRVQSTGLIGKLLKVRFDAKVTGRVTRNTYVPTRYEEAKSNGRRKSESILEYRAGVPQVKKYLPPRKAAAGMIAPSTQAGTVDPLTAIYLGMRDVNEDELCKLELFLFDGTRRAQLTIVNPSKNGNDVRCDGEYRRIAGFSPQEMAKKARFPFTVQYARLPEGKYRVMKISMETLYGSGTLKRR